MRQILWTLIAVTGTATSAVAQIDVISCLLSPSREISVGSPVEGVIAEFAVERGQHVAQGDVLVRIDARVEEAQLEAARFRARNDAVVQSRRVQRDEAERLYAQVLDLSERGVATNNQLEEVRAQKFLAEAQLREAENEQASARLEVASAEVALEQRVIVAPTSGVILTRLADAGELAAGGAPLLELVSVDVLHAEVLAPAADYGGVALGQSVPLTSENADAVLTGQISAIDPVIDAASRSFGFRIDVANPDGLFVAGNRCDLVQP